MLAPDYLYHISDRAVELYEQLNVWAVKDICRRLVNAGFQFTGSVDRQVYKLQESGMHLDEVTKMVAQLTKKSETEIAEIFKEASFKSQEYDNTVYKRAGLTPIDIRQSPQMLKILQVTYEQTMGEIRNFTRTTANASQTLFLDTVDEVYFRVMGGRQSYTEAVRQAVDRVSSNGVTVLYPTGHKDTIETAVRRCIVTGVGQATARISIRNAAEMGTDLVLVSAHMGARPEHAEWQGKVYSISGTDKKYSALVEATGYGTVSGLCGANCRHHFMPYIEGISSNPYEDFDSGENEEYYRNQQEQRKKERCIRSTKRELQTLEDSLNCASDEKLKFALQQDYERKSARLKAQNADYREYCREKGLRTQQERLRVAGSNKAVIGKKENQGMAPANLDDISENRKIQKFIGENDSVFKGTIEEQSEIAYNMVSEYCTRESKWKKKTVINDGYLKKEGAYARKQWNCIIMARNDTPPKSLIHEQLHARSANYLNRLLYIKYHVMEEASVELMAREICKDKGISFSYVKRKPVENLIRIHEICGFEENILSFAVRLFSRPLEDRFRWLENKVNRYIKNTGKNADELTGLLKELKG